MSSAKKFIVLFVTISSCLVSARAQELRMGNRDLTDREKDGFSGAVRRVKVESAKVTVKEGKPVEGSKLVRAVTTYDIKGRRIDTVAHPVQVTTPSGREQYRYDEKGNLVEMTVRGSDGSILSREAYEYEFDEIGNWKRMISSIVTYEDGKLSLEPIEVTYRTLTYFYTQAIERVVQTAQARAATPKTGGSPQANVAAEPVATLPSIENSTAAEKEKPRNDQAEGVATGDGATPVAPAAPPEPVSVTAVSEAVLRAAATSLPAAAMPLIGQLRPMYRKVLVHVILDEKGEVVSARGTSPETVFNDAAEAAARQAKFAPDKLSDKPTRLFGVLSYEFDSGITQPAIPSTDAKSEMARVLMDSEAPPSVAPAEKMDSFSTGVLHLNNREYAKAEEVFKALVYRNPDDSKGYVHLALAYFGEQKYVEAIAAFKLAMKLRPDLVDAKTYYLLGASYHALRKYSEGVKALQQGIYVLRAAKVEAETSETLGQPTLFQFHYNLGVLYQASGASFEAIKAFRQAASLNQDAAEPHYGLALVYLGMGDRASADREQRILRSLNAELAKKIAEAVASRTLYIPPGCTALPCP